MGETEDPPLPSRECKIPQWNKGKEKEKERREIEENDKRYWLISFKMYSIWECLGSICAHVWLKMMWNAKC